VLLFAPRTRHSVRVPHRYRGNVVDGCHATVPRGRLATLRANRLFEPLSPVPHSQAVPRCPALTLFTAELDDAAVLVRGMRPLQEGASTPAKRKACDVEAARQWVERGDIGTVTFDEAATWLGLDPERTRRAILAAVVRRV
jgi:hypothetical protein